MLRDKQDKVSGVLPDRDKAEFQRHLAIALVKQRADEQAIVRQRESLVSQAIGQHHMPAVFHHRRQCIRGHDYRVHRLELAHIAMDIPPVHAHIEAVVHRHGNIIYRQVCFANDRRMAHGNNRNQQRIHAQFVIVKPGQRRHVIAMAGLNHGTGLLVPIAQVPQGNIETILQRVTAAMPFAVKMPILLQPPNDLVLQRVALLKGV